MRTLLVTIILILTVSGLKSQSDSCATKPDSAITVLKDTLRPDFTVYNDSGIASWYGPKWKGRLTASGEYFDPDSMTAAHKWLPFGTIVKVTNVENDSVVYVRITDRLPKKSTRTIDLTPIAAKRLGFYSKGLQKVRIESVGKTPVIKKKISAGADQRIRRQ